MAESKSWEQDTLQKLLFETLKEQRRKRRWNIFFKLIFFSLAAFIIFSTNSTDFILTKPHTAVIAIHGIIASGNQASADNVIAALEKAFDEKNTQGIILDINSPGGSAVQASYIYNEIVRQRALHKNIPLYATCQDACASAAYYIASGAQAIYANPASLVGSIGSLIDGFGFTGTMDKLGVQRRLITSGMNKGFLDPFSPLSKEDEAYAKHMLDEVHSLFIHDVKQGRGNRLKITDETFSGRVWTGISGKALGLIDGFGSVETVTRDILKSKNIIRYNDENDLLQQLSGRFTSSLKQSIKSELAPSIS
ncbi:MAG: hypothetical protein A3G71_06875 [Gammaproteobacteria bacterium RIFCSPLOWO2_12_FULL_38_14]|nr:MAG: hypothetical protein A3B69_04975 [Gammaproteobacteria bacterium RIFCSPHIGHO2_02_FULL_38_33]OGT24045.1 MAG: hypothetical protein A2W47_06860 [Gammaproteobacteria bacterium RIFCSPHIGHO2_12_38_15]OGT75776.1 MAG: hypothetical protein A3G71_06875 [Gammaproteobacteria bacterium RIFCSPLOWO2_12_FULL_38_14]